MQKACITETDRSVIALLEALVPRQHSHSSAKDSRTYHCQSICVRLRREEDEEEEQEKDEERGEAGREVGFLVDDWRRGLGTGGRGCRMEE